jgi:hypothetical protein
MDIDQFFARQPDSRSLFDVLCETITAFGRFEMRVTKSQIAFRRRKTFAIVWIPDRYLHRELALLVLTMGFSYRHPSSRWKQIVEPHPGYFTHHLELYSVTDIDGEVAGWLQAAWENAA